MRERRAPQPAVVRCKLVLVGDVQCGKTAMLQVLAKDCYPEVSCRPPACQGPCPPAGQAGTPTPPPRPRLLSGPPGLSFPRDLPHFGLPAGSFSPLHPSDPLLLSCILDVCLSQERELEALESLGFLLDVIPASSFSLYPPSPPRVP